MLSGLLIILQQDVDADRLAVLDGLQAMSVHPQTKLLLKQALYKGSGNKSHRSDRQLQDKGLALLLRDYVGSSENPRELRIFGLANLNEHHPEVVRAETKQRMKPMMPPAELLVAAATTITGSVMLGSVGIWGG